MRKFFKWTGMVLGSLVGIVILSGAGLFVRGRGKSARAPVIAVTAPAVSTDSAVIERGRHLVTAVVACTGCHGAGLKGQPFDTPPILVSMAAPNLTPGKGGVGADYEAADWDRAIRHGVARDGRRLIIMPSEVYAHMNDADLSAVVSYLETLAPVDNELPRRKVGAMGGIMIGAGLFPLATDIIAKEQITPSTTPFGVNAEYGGYLMSIAGCKSCHGPNLGGMPGHGGPDAPSLLANAQKWDQTAFINTLRTGQTPDGRKLDGNAMPWPNYANMTDEELISIYLHLQTVQPQ